MIEKIVNCNSLLEIQIPIFANSKKTQHNVIVRT